MWFSMLEAPVGPGVPSPFSGSTPHGVANWSCSALLFHVFLGLPTTWPCRCMRPPQHLVRSGALSNAQIETVIYSFQRFEGPRMSTGEFLAHVHMSAVTHSRRRVSRHTSPLGPPPPPRLQG